MARTKPVPGNVCQFALGDGRFAYGRLLRDASVAIYRTTSTEPATPPIGERDFAFVVGIYSDVPGSTACPIVGRDSFETDDDAWPPPSKIVDPITQQVRIYHHGEIQDAEEPGAASELETAAVYELHHIVERIREALPP